MKQRRMKVLSWLLVFVMLLGIASQTTSEVKASGVVPTGLATAYAGDRLRITVPGDYVNKYQTTNFSFSTNENTIAHIWAYDENYSFTNTDEENEEALIYDEYVCSGSFADTFIIRMRDISSLSRYSTAIYSSHIIPRIRARSRPSVRAHVISLTGWCRGRYRKRI